ncbi:MAG: T9SS type A sorting domain-containing protein [Ignavibacteriae bacterium]|nr:T9SS type A sorting domain-containing protein [Ignavibacteriota bacterium]
MGTYFAEGIGMTANLTPEVGGYRLRGARIAGTVYGTITSVDDGTTGGVPSEFALLQNYPNPFNPVTTIRFTVPVTVGTGPAGIALAGRHALSLRVYDVLGREVATLVNEQKSPGTYTVTWDASNQSSGVYLYQLRAGGFVQTKKMIIIQ